MANYYFSNQISNTPIYQGTITADRNPQSIQASMVDSNSIPVRQPSLNKAGTKPSAVSKPKKDTTSHWKDILGYTALGTTVVVGGFFGVKHLKTHLDNIKVKPQEIAPPVVKDSLVVEPPKVETEAPKPQKTEKKAKVKKESPLQRNHRQK